MYRCGHEEEDTLAMLKRRKGETTDAAVVPLDLAIARLRQTTIFTDEINPPAKSQRP